MSEETTLPNFETMIRTILERISGLEEGIDRKFDEQFTEFLVEIDKKIDRKFREKFDAIRREIAPHFEEFRRQLMSLDVRLDRVEALTHEVLNITLNNRADVKVFREEVGAWADDARQLQLRAA
jgi:hypothetical protein